MSEAPPILECVWTGAAFEPTRRHHNLAAANYGPGEIVRLTEHHDRSMKSHGHYFVMVGEAFDNLPEAYEGRWQSSEHLRKWALIKSGHCDERSIVCASKAEAQRLAAFIKPMDEYALVVPSEAVVTVYTAKSQSMKAMGKETFQKSKDDVLGVLAGLLEVAPAALRQAVAA